MPTDKRPPSPDHLTLLACGEVEILGRMPWSSNRTYLANCTIDEAELAAIYKPGRGERPLWDFGDNLWRREVAAYEVSEATGWNLVPETITRADGPLGQGSLQRFVPADFEQHYFTLLSTRRTTTGFVQSALSMSSSITPTVRAGTVCSARTATSGRSITGFASTASRS